MLLKWLWCFKTWCHETSKREHRQNIIWHKLYQSFLRSVSQGNRNKIKKQKVVPNQTYKVLHSKGKHKQNEKTIYGMGGNICKPWDQKRLNVHNIQTSAIPMKLLIPRTSFGAFQFRISSFLQWCMRCRHCSSCGRSRENEVFGAIEAGKWKLVESFEEMLKPISQV